MRRPRTPAFPLLLLLLLLPSLFVRTRATAVAHGTGLSLAHVHQPSSFDVVKNAATAHGVEVYLDAAATVTVVDAGACYTVTYVPSTPGHTQLHVLSNGVALTPPYDVTVLPDFSFAFPPRLPAGHSDTTLVVPLTSSFEPHNVTVQCKLRVADVELVTPGIFTSRAVECPWESPKSAVSLPASLFVSVSLSPEFGFIALPGSLEFFEAPSSVSLAPPSVSLEKPETRVSLSFRTSPMPPADMLVVSVGNVAVSDLQSSFLDDENRVFLSFLAPTFSTSFAAAEVQVAVSLNGGVHTHVVGSLAVFGPLDPAQTYAVGGGLLSAVANSDEVSTFSIIARDRAGRNIGVGGESFEIMFVGAHSIHSVTDNNDGSYLVEYFFTEPPTDVSFSARLLSTGEPILGSPWYPVILSARTIDYTKSTVLGTENLERLSVGVPSTLLVITKDQDGNHLAKGGAPLRLLATNAGGQDASSCVTSSVHDHHNGSYAISVTLASLACPSLGHDGAGRHTLSFAVVGAAADSPHSQPSRSLAALSSLTVGAGPIRTLLAIAASSCTASGNGLGNVASYQIRASTLPQEFAIQCRDATNTPIIDPAFVNEIVATYKMTNAVGIPATVLWGGADVFAVKYVVTISGLYSIEVQTTGLVSFPGSPFNFQIFPSTLYSPEATAYNFGNSESLAGQETGFLIQGRDSFGNAIFEESPGVPFGFYVTSGQVRLPVQGVVSALTASRWNCSFTATVSGDYQIIISAIDQPSPAPAIKNSNQPWKVLPNLATGAKSTANFPQILTAGQTTTGFIYGKDIYENLALQGYFESVYFRRKVNGVLLETATVLSITNSDPNNPTDLWHIQYTATVSGVYEVSLRTIAPSPLAPFPEVYQATVSPERADQVNPECGGEGTGLSLAFAATRTSFTVYCLDLYKNRVVSNFGVNVEFVTKTPQQIIDPTAVSSVFNAGQWETKYGAVSQGDGTWTGTYTAPGHITPFTIEVTIIASGVNNQIVMPGSPFTAQATAAPVDNSTYCFPTNTSAPVVGGVVNVTQHMYITCVDRLGNPFNQASGLRFFAKLNNTQTELLRAIDTNTGQWDVQYTATVAGNYVLSVHIDATSTSLILPPGGGAPRTEILYSPWPVTFVGAAISVRHCLVTGSAVVGGYAGEPLSITVQARDAFSNPIGNGGTVAFAVATQGPSPAFGTTLLGAAGLWSLLGGFQLTKVGWHNVSVTGDSVHVIGSPFPIYIQQGPFAALRCFASGPGLDGVAHQNIPISFTITARDAYDNVFTSVGDVVFAVKLMLGNGGGVVDGTITANLTATNNYERVVKWHGWYTPVDFGTGYNVFITAANVANQVATFPIAGSPWPLVINAAVISVPHSIADGPGLSSVVAGETGYFTVHGRDFGNNTAPYPGPNFKFTTVLLGLTTVEVFSKTESTIVANYSVSYVVTVAGTYSMTVRSVPVVLTDVLGGVVEHDILGSPFTVEVRPAPLSFERSSAVIVNATVGILANFTIQGRDRFDNNLKSDAGFSVSPFRVSISAAGVGPLQGFVSSNGNGQWSGSYLTTVAGQYAVFVTSLLGVPIRGSPFLIDQYPSTMSVPTSVAVGAALTQSVVGTNSVFKIQGRDRYHNNLIRRQFTNFNVQLDGPQTKTASVLNNNDGSWAVNYLLTVAGTYAMVITEIGTNLPIKGSPFSTKLIPQDLFIGSTETSGQGLTGAITGVEANFRILARDVYLNYVTIAPYRMEVILRGPVQVAGIVDNLDRGLNGVWSVRYTVTVAGSYLMSIDAFKDGQTGSVPIPNLQGQQAPFPVEIRPAVLSPRSCNVTGDGQRSAVAGQTAIIGVLALDIYGNIVPAEGFQFSVGPNIFGNMFASSVGRYSGQWLATQSGDYTLTIKTADTQEHVASSPYTVTVYPAALSVFSSVASGPGLALSSAGVLSPITITAKDVYGNRLTSSGGGSWLVVVQGEFPIEKERQEPPAVDNSDGTWTVSLTHKFVGYYTVSITSEVSAAHILGSPFEVQVLPGALDTSQSIVRGKGYVEATAGLLSAFEILGLDSNGNSLTTNGGISWTLHLYGPATVPVKISDSTTGLWLCSYTATISGKYTLSIVSSTNRQLKGSPFTVDIASNTASARTTNIQDLVFSAVAGVAYNFTVQVRDTYGNKRFTGGDEFKVTTSMDDASVGYHDNNDGTYTMTFTARRVGLLTVNVFINFDAIAGSPMTVTVLPADLDPSTSQIFGTGLEGGVAGAALSITIIGMDFNRNSAPGLGANIDVRLNGEKLSVKEIQDGRRATGTYIVDFTVVKAAPDHLLTAQYKNVSFVGSPFYLNVAPGPTSALGSFAEGRGVNGGVRGETVGFIIHARDEYDNPRSLGGDQFSVFTISGPTEVVATVKDPGNGLYSVTYSVAIKGTYKMRVVLGADADIKDSPFTVLITVQPDFANYFSAEGDGLRTAVVDLPASFNVLTLDANFKEEGMTFVVRLLDSNGKAQKAVTEITPEYVVSYTPTVSGNITLIVLLGGAEIVGSPWPVTILPGVLKPELSTATGPLSGEIVAGEENVIVITERDQHGNSRAGQPSGTGSSFFMSQITNIDTGTPKFSLAKNKGNSIHESTFVVTQVGTLLIAVSLNNVPIKDSPFSNIKVVPGQPYGPQCVAQGDGLGLAAGGLLGNVGQEAGFTITTKDQWGNLVSKGGAHFEVHITNNGGYNLYGAVTDHGDGTYDVKYMGTLSGRFLLNIKLENTTHIKSSPFTVDILFGLTDPQGSRVEGLDLAIVDETKSFFILAGDRYGNLVNRGDDQFNVKIDGPVRTGGTILDNTDGTYSVFFYVSLAGLYDVFVYLDDTPIANSPFEVLAVASNASNVQITGGFPAQSTAGDELQLRVRASDKFGNVLTPESPLVPAISSVWYRKQVNEVQGNSVVAYQEQFVINAVQEPAGIFVIHYAIPLAGEYSVSVLSNGAEIQGSPVLTLIKPGVANNTRSRVIAHSLSSMEKAVEASFRIVANDRFENNVGVGGQNFTAHIDTGIPISLVDNGDGSFSGRFFPAEQTTIKLSILLDGLHVDKSPYSINIVPGNQATEPRQCTVVAGLPLRTSAGRNTSFVIQARNAYGLDVTVGGVLFTPRVLGPGLVHVPPPLDLQNGQYRVTFTPTISGSYSVIVTTIGEDKNPVAISGSPFSAQVVPGPTSHKGSTVAGLSPLYFVDDEIKFQFVPKDQYGNLQTEYSNLPIEDFEIVFALNKPTIPAGRDPTLQERTIIERADALAASQQRFGLHTDYHNGTHIGLWSTTISGKYSLFATFNGEPLSLGPFTTQVFPGAYNSSVGPEPLVVPPNRVYPVKPRFFAGKEGHLTLLGKDRFGNFRQSGGGNPPFAANFTPAVSSMGTSFVDNFDGSFSLAFMCTAAGRYWADVKFPYTPVNGTVNDTVILSVEGSPFELIVAPNVADAPSCVASGEGLFNASVTAPATLLVKAVDAWGNLVAPGTTVFEAELSGPTAIPAQVVETSDMGYFRVTFHATRSGQYNMRVVLLPDGENVRGSPFSPTVYSGAPVAGRSQVTQTSRLVSIAGEDAAFTVNVEDDLGNLVNSARFSSLFSVRVTRTLIPATPSTPALLDLFYGSAIYISPGKFRCFYTPTVTGAYSIDVRFNQESVKLSPFDAEVGPSSISPANCTAAGLGLQTSFVGEQRTFSILSRDRFGNRVMQGNNPVTVELTGPAIVPVDVKDLGDGEYVASYTAQTRGKYKASVYLIGVEVQNSPFSLQLESMPAAAQGSVALGEGLRRGITGAKTSFQLHSGDKFGNRLSYGGLVWTVEVRLISMADYPSNKGPFVPLDRIVSDHQNGRYSVEYTPLISGEYLITVSLNGQQLGESPWVARIAPSASSPAHSTASGPGLVGGIPGQELPFVIQTSDAYQNKRTTGGDFIKVALRAPNKNPALLALKDNQDGSYIGSYIPATTGTHELEVTLNGLEINGSPFKANVVSSSGVPEAALSVAHGDGLIGAVAGQSTYFQLDAIDASGIILDDDINIKFFVTMTGVSAAGDAVSLRPNVNFDSTFEAHIARYMPTISGRYTIEIVLGTTPIRDSPWNIIVGNGPASASMSRLMGGGARTIVAGDLTPVDVESLDRYGNLVQYNPLVKDYYQLEISGGGQLLLLVPKNMGDGTYHADFRGYVAGEYQARATLQGVELRNSPVLFTVIPAVRHTPSCIALGAGVYRAVAGSLTLFSITVRDEYDNDISRGGDPFRVVFEGAPHIVASVEESPGGFYLASYLSDVAGNFTMHVTVNSEHISGSPFKVSVQPAATSLPLTLVSGQGANVSHVGKPSLFHLQARDKYGNHRTQGGDLFMVRLVGDQTIYGSVTDHKNGTYDVVYSTYTSGFYQMVIMLNGQSIVAGFAIESIPDQPDPLQCTAGGTGLNSAVSGSPSRFRVQARDQYRSVSRVNQNADFQAWLRLSTASPRDIVNATVSDLLHGLYGFQYQVTRAGSYVMHVTLRGKQIAGSPFRPVAVAGPTYPYGCVVHGVNIGGSTTLAVALTHTLLVSLYDEWGNVAVYNPLVLVDTVHVQLVPSQAQVSVANNQNGTFTVTLFFSVVSEYSMLVNVNRQPVRGSPFALHVVAGQAAPSRASAFGKGRDQGKANQEGLFSITSADRFGNTINEGSVPYDVVLVLPKHSVPAAVTPAGPETPGVMSVSYMTTVAGHYTLRVSLRGIHINGSPFAMLIVSTGVTSGRMSTATGFGLPGGVIGSTVEFEIQARDEFGNIINSTLATLDRDAWTVTFNPISAGLNLVTTTREGGVTRVSYTVGVEVDFTISVTYRSGEHIQGSPFNAIGVVLEGLPVPSKCVAQGSGLEGGIAGQQSVFNIYARDENRILLTRDASRVTFDISVLGGTNQRKVEGKITYLGAGVNQATFLPTIAGPYVVSVLLDNIHIFGSEFKFNVDSAETDPAQTTVLGGPKQNAVVVQSNQVIILAADRFGNRQTYPSNFQGDRFEAVLEGKALPVVDRFDSTYVVSMDFFEIGEYELVIKLRNQEIKDSPVILTVGPGIRNVPRCEAYGDAVHRGVVGRSNLLFVQNKDSLGNNVTIPDAPFVVTLDMVTKTQTHQVLGSVTYSADGLYLVSYYTTIAGNWLLTIKYDKEFIKGAPFNLTVGAGAAKTSEILGFGPGVSRGYAAEVNTFTIQVRDSWRNNATEGGMFFSVSLEGQAGFVRGEVTDHNNGTYTGSYTTTTIGPLRLHVTRNQEHILGSPFDVTIFAGKTDVAQTIATGNGITDGIAGEELEVVVRTRDKYQNPRVVGGETFIVDLVGPDIIQRGIEDHNDGTYSVKYQPTIIGWYTLAITLHGKHIVGSPFRMFMSAGAANTGSSRVSGDGVLSKTVGVDSTIMVHPKDFWSNDRTTQGGDSVVVRVSGVGVEILADVRYDPNPGPHDNELHLLGGGHFVSVFNLRAAGEYAVRVNLNDLRMPGSPFAVQIIPGKSDASTCFVQYGTWRESGTKVGEPAEFVIISRDKYQNLRKSGGTTFDVLFVPDSSVTAPAGLGITPVVTDTNDGKYPVRYTTETAGQYKVHITQAGQHIEKSPYDHTVHPDVVSPLHCTASGLGLSRAVKGVPARFEIQPRDKYSNRLYDPTNIFFGVTMSGASNASSVNYALPLSVQWAGDHFDVELTPSEDHLITVVLEEVPIFGSAFTLLVTSAPGPAHALNTVLTGIGLHHAVAGERAELAIQSVDKNGYPSLDKGDFQVVVDNVFGVRAIYALLEFDGNGLHSASYTATVSGAYTMNILLSGVPVRDRPWPLTVAPAATSPAHCSLQTNVTSERLVAGHYMLVTLKTRDKFGNPRDYDLYRGLDDIEAVATLPSKSEEVLPVWDNKDGTASYVYRPVEVGVHTLVTKVLGSVVAAPKLLSALQVVPGPRHAPSCVATGEGLLPENTVVSGLEALFTIQSKDEFHNDVVVAGDAFSVRFSNAVTSFRGRVLPLTQGKYTTTYLATVAGTYRVDITTQGAHIQDSPFKIQVTPAAASVANLVAVGSGYHTAVAGQPATFVLNVHDKFGNPTTVGASLQRVSVKLKQQDVPAGKFPAEYTADAKFDGARQWLITYTVYEKTRFLLSIFVNDIQVKEILPRSINVVPAPAPRLLWARFSDSGASIIVKFDRSTDRAGMVVEQPSCLPILTEGTVSLLGKLPPTCLWQDSLTLVVSMGFNALAKVNDPLVLRDEALQTAQRHSFYAVGVTLILEPLNPSPVFADLKAPMFVSPCDRLHLDGSGSNGGLGRPLVYSWGLLVPSAEYEELQRYLVTLPANASFVDIASSELRLEQSYTFVLKVENFLGQRAEQQRVVTLTQHAFPPLLVLEGSAVQEVQRAVPLRLGALARMPSCARKSKVYYQWSLLAGPAFDLHAKTANTLALYVPPYTLRVGSTYVFQLRAVVDSAPTAASLESSVRVTVRVIPGAIRAAIKGGSRTINANNPLILDASPSADMDRQPEPFVFRWECHTHDVERLPCFADTLDTRAGLLHTSGAVLELPVDQLPDGEYLFSVYALKEPGPRWGYAEVTITVVHQAVPDVYIIAPHVVNADSRLVLRGIVDANATVASSQSFVARRQGQPAPAPTSASALSISYNWWTVEGEFRSGVQQTLTSSMLSDYVLAPYTLMSGQRYRFRMDVVVSTKQGIIINGFAEALVLVNSAPTSGRFEAWPRSGVAVDTVFSLSLMDWVDAPEDLPLTYEFRYALQDANGAAWAAEAGERVISVGAIPAVTTTLPVMVPDATPVVLVGYVWDNKGASARIITSVTLSPYVFVPEYVSQIPAAAVFEKRKEVVAAGKLEDAVMLACTVANLLNNPVQFDVPPNLPQEPINVTVPLPQFTNKPTPAPTPLPTTFTTPAPTLPNTTSTTPTPASNSTATPSPAAPPNATSPATNSTTTTTTNSTARRLLTTAHDQDADHERPPPLPFYDPSPHGRRHHSSGHDGRHDHERVLHERHRSRLERSLQAMFHEDVGAAVLPHPAHASPLYARESAGLGHHHHAHARSLLQLHSSEGAKLRYEVLALLKTAAMRTQLRTQDIWAMADVLVDVLRRPEDISPAAQDTVVELVNLILASNSGGVYRAQSSVTIEESDASLLESTGWVLLKVLSDLIDAAFFVVEESPDQTAVDSVLRVLDSARELLDRLGVELLADAVPDQQSLSRVTKNLLVEFSRSSVDRLLSAPVMPPVDHSGLRVEFQLPASLFTKTGLVSQSLQKAAQIPQTSNFPVHFDSVVVEWQQNPFVSLARINSKVTSLKLFVGEVEQKVEQLASPIEIVIPTQSQTGVDEDINTCRWWNNSAAQWSGLGCLVVSVQSSAIVCQCFHLTDFGSMVVSTVPDFNTVVAVGSSALVPASPQDRLTLLFMVAGILGTYVVFLTIGARADNTEERDNMLTKSALSKHVKSTRLTELLPIEAVLSSTVLARKTMTRAKLWKLKLTQMARRKHSLLGIMWRLPGDNFSRPMRITCLFLHIMACVVACAWVISVQGPSFTNLDSLVLGTAVAVALFPFSLFFPYIFSKCDSPPKEPIKFGRPSRRASATIAALPAKEGKDEKGGRLSRPLTQRGQYSARVFGASQPNTARSAWGGNPAPSIDGRPAPPAQRPQGGGRPVPSGHPDPGKPGSPLVSTLNLSGLNNGKPPAPQPLEDGNYRPQRKFSGTAASVPETDRSTYQDPALDNGPTTGVRGLIFKAAMRHERHRSRGTAKLPYQWTWLSYMFAVCFFAVSGFLTMRFGSRFQPSMEENWFIAVTVAVCQEMIVHQTLRLLLVVYYNQLLLPRMYGTIASWAIADIAPARRPERRQLA